MDGVIHRPPRAFRPSFLLGLGAAVALVACAGPSAASSTQPTDVKVTMGNFKIDSPTTTFKAGVPYRFVVTNAGTVNHEFMVVPPPKAGESSDDLDKVAVGRIDEETFGPGSTQTLTVTFAKPVTAGTLEFACHVPGHYEQGMHTPITVSE